MKSEWKIKNLDEIATIKYGKNQKKVQSDNGEIPIYGTGGLMGYATEYLYNKESVLIGRKGTIDKIRYVNHPFWTVDTLFYTIINEDIIIPRYLYYYLSTIDFMQMNEGTTIPSLRTETLNRMEIPVPDIETQHRIASILSALDDKIELNNQINKNLEQQAQALFKSWFVDTENQERKECRVEDYFDISIGKTPPRKEQEWFSKNNSDVKWVSISDMGSCGTFIMDSSEYLTKEAIEKYNVKVVPANTVLLSFKLTVGRVAITINEMATNEAIAHFKAQEDTITEYLYCYLKSFNYQELGSTSSIATAVNSKIIKGMPFIVPTNEEKQAFHDVVYPMFAEIRKNQIENQRLSALRDTLLPKLMNGEIDVSKVKI